jgi:hypothetical protein
MVLLWILVFILGGVSGAVGYHIYWNQARKPNPEIFIQKMARYLKLDSQQAKSLKAIFDESIQKHKEANKQVQALHKDIVNETRRKIENILQPDQKLLYEEWLKKYRPRKPPGAAESLPPSSSSPPPK